MIGYLEGTVGRRRPRLLQMIQIQPKIVDRDFGGLVGRRRKLRAETILQLVALQCRRFGRRRVGRRTPEWRLHQIRVVEVHQLGFDRRFVARRHLARRRLIRAALRRVEREVQVVGNRMQSR